MKINIGYFALLREQTGVPGEVWETEGKTPLELFNELKLHYGLTIEEKLIKVAVNDRFANMNTALDENDKVVFIPPVAGG